ncbi:GTP1/OBG [Acrodontium crateriforme]|uniref:GTP1/OBG n=1 Tax=Acrodontium crateriforme TaxID=150365 RepID=A0AAQ3R9C2_9PEZI|nr:GTP1/OBG [Acrodontium crateriforme]
MAGHHAAGSLASLRTSSNLLLSSTLTPFLYPCLDIAWQASSSAWSSPSRLRHNAAHSPIYRRSHGTFHTVSSRRSDNISTASQLDVTTSNVDVNQYDHLDPSPPDYSSAPFTDTCTLTVAAGAGGHGCISFLREKYIAHGPANGGDGGTGGSIYIQAVHGETSLHKLARRGIVKAERGRNGQGSMRGGSRGEDVLIVVPVGTVVREIWRHDPLEEEDGRHRKGRGFGSDMDEDVEGEDRPDQSRKWRRDKWLLYPGTLPKSFTSADFPALPRPRRNNLVATQPPAPLRLDLDKPMDKPLLLAAGAMGGLGNPHFVTKSVPRPKYATKGEDGTRIHVELSLKLLADVGLVGLPNAGKSTLLRALTRSRTRVGNWAFTTLAPNVGTVVLDNYKGRPRISDNSAIRSTPRTNFTIADIPGLIEDAHLDRGLGLGFLRHVERAAMLAFVIDLSAGDAVKALQALWREVSEYEKIREEQLNADTEHQVPDENGLVTFRPFESSISPDLDPEPIDEEDLVLDPPVGRELPPLALPPISSKPWFVVATKADLPETQENFFALQAYLKKVQAGAEAHPSGKKNAWKRTLSAVPVSAIRKEGVEGIPELVIGLLDG